MRLSPKEIEKLMLHQAGALAQKRYARGLLLNYPETIALIAAQLLEFIREGHSVSELMDKGKKILGLDDVLPGVPEMVDEVQVEGTFPDGTKLVTVHHPVCDQQGDEALALFGSGLTRSGNLHSPDNITTDKPGERIVADDEIVLNPSRETLELSVINKGDRPIQVGSHYPFFETNSFLQFDREQAYGYRLNIPAGTAVRFEPGEEKKVPLVKIAGEQIIRGGNALISGQLSESNKSEALQRASKNNFLSK
jgi:urease subunit gamma/beta